MCMIYVLCSHIDGSYSLSLRKLMEKLKYVMFKVLTRNNLLSITYKLQNSYSSLSSQKVPHREIKTKINIIVKLVSSSLSPLLSSPWTG